MTQWQYMHIQVTPGGSGEEYVLTPSVSDLQSTLQQVGRVQSVDLLNELGSDGWELVASMENPERHWLKRQPPEPDHVQHAAFGIR